LPLTAFTGHDKAEFVAKISPVPIAAVPRGRRRKPFEPYRLESMENDDNLSKRLPVIPLVNGCLS
jgi:hypothetical protein